MTPPGLRSIAAASRLLPGARRHAWRREWEAEVSYAWRRLEREGRTGHLTRARLHLRALTCWIDALMERKETMTMTGLLNDLRFAARSLMRYRAFTAVAVLTLALGIGANTAVFTLVDHVLLKPLPFTESERLLSLEHLGRDGQDALPISPGLYLLYRDRAHSIEGVAMYTGTAANFMTDGRPERIMGQSATPSFFRVLRTSALQGRTFGDEEAIPDAEPVVLLSEGLWRTNFGADPAIVGRTIEMSGTTRRVVGVMPAGFGFPDRTARFWVPLVVDETHAPLAAFFASGLARMADGATLESVRSEIEGLTSRLPEIFPGDGGATFLREVGLRARVEPLKERLVGDVARTLWILLGTVGTVLVIACANVANLLLVRAEGRQRELAMRVAVGAGRLQVLRGFMGESIALATAGGGLGLAVAAIAVRVTTRMIPTDLPRLEDVGVDLRVLAFTAVVALGCAIFFGLFPLLRHGNDDLAAQLREGGTRGTIPGSGRNRLRNGLVIGQIGLALVLLVGSGLMFRSFLALRSVDPGFDTDGILTARLIVPSGEIADWQETMSYFRQVRDRMAQQGGVVSVGLTTSVPLGGEAGFQVIEVEDQPRAEGELPVFAATPQADVGYLEAMGIDLVEGRTFERGDGGDGTRAVVVSRSFAQHWWPNGGALGRRLRYGAQDEDWYTIVGVVDDVLERGLEEPPQETVYFPTLVDFGGQYFPARAQDIVIRTDGDPTSLLPVLRREMQAVNARIPLANPRTMGDVFRAATARTSFTMSMLGAASGIALLLGLVGIYGVVSYMVSQRTREIGVRMALGATAGTVRGMVVRQGLVLSAGGVAGGLLGAFGLSRVMGSLLYGVSPTDPATYVIVSALLVAIATLASWLPALRAAGVDPSRALRAE